MTVLRNGTGDINKIIFGCCAGCLQLACACVQKAPHPVRAGGEAGWAEHCLTGSSHRNTPEVRNSFKRNGFPRMEQASDRDRCQSSPVLLVATPLYHRSVFWVYYCRLLASHTTRYRAEEALLRRNPCFRGHGAFERSYPLLLLAGAVTYSSCQSEWWLNRSLQGTQEGGESTGAD